MARFWTCRMPIGGEMCLKPTDGKDEFCPACREQGAKDRERRKRWPFWPTNDDGSICSPPKSRIEAELAKPEPTKAARKPFQLYAEGPATKLIDDLGFCAGVVKREEGTFPCRERAAVEATWPGCPYNQEIVRMCEGHAKTAQAYPGYKVVRALALAVKP